MTDKNDLKSVFDETFALVIEARPFFIDLLDAGLNAGYNELPCRQGGTIDVPYVLGGADSPEASRSFALPLSLLFRQELSPDGDGPAVEDAAKALVNSFDAVALLVAGVLNYEELRPLAKRMFFGCRPWTNGVRRVCPKSGLCLNLEVVRPGELVLSCLFGITFL